MSIKKLFEDANKTNTFLAETNQKDAFEPVESEQNVEQRLRSQERYVPQVDYSEPANFVKYGSARLYYESAFNRILDYYPYDGSQAEITKFHNDNLDIEEYILEKRYPKSTGYITLARDGFTISAKSADGYGTPTTAEYIDFKGGPGTGSAATSKLTDLLPNPYSDSRKEANLYSSNIYTDKGLPSDYGKGSRQSNLRANFDDGVTIEFWMKTGSMTGVNSDKQVIFDSWNNSDPTSSAYGRITLELTGTVSSGGAAKNPFIITVQSGASQPTSVDTMKILGRDSIHESMGEWNHYAIRLYNTGSSNNILKTELYVNGYRNDSSSWAPYSLNTELEISKVVTPTWYLDDAQYRYTSSGSLKGWWRFDGSAITTTSPEPDASGNKHTGSISLAAQAPATSTSTPSAYIQTTGSNVWGADATDAVRVGTAATWDAIIGNNTAGGSTEMMTFAAWVYKTGDGGGNLGRVFDFGAQDIALYSNASEALLFNTKWNGNNIVQWTSATGVFSLNAWTHIAITYDARSVGNNPKLYINGASTAMPLTTGTQTGAYYGIVTQECVVGNNAAGTRNWAGNLADVAVWNSILEENEIKALYQAGNYKQQFNKITELNSKNMTGRIGALITTPNSSSAPAGAGRLSASLDEFRYWKAARTPKQIGEYWFDQVRGGSNTDISNADLGIYYKFNEGITANTAIDSIVLDYAGRAVNGIWTGYSTISRNTGSAIVSASAAAFEFEDPIIRSAHPSVVNLKSELVTSGTSYDYNNNASLMSLMPGWIQDEAADSDNSDIYYINHIAGTYFDKIHLQISQLPNLRHVNYVSSSHKPLPFSRHLPQSLGLYAPEMFIESDVLEAFADRDSTTLFENKLDETKNLIYQNLYNNLAHIFKSKGTERAMRSVMRCFNIDNGLYNININSNNEEYVLRNNFKHSLLKKNFLNFNNLENTTAVVYQRKTSSVGPEYGSILSWSPANTEQPKYGFTCESNIIFPAYAKTHTAYERDSNFNTVHLFGIEQVEASIVANVDGTDTTYTPGREASFRVYAIRESVGSKNVHFHLTSSRTDGLGISLTSSVFLNVYDNEPWNLSIRVEPQSSLQAGVIDRGTATPLYNVIFTGFNPRTANEIDSFKVTASVTETVGKQFITGSRRIFVGSDRTNITGALNYRSDVQVGSVAYWTKALHDDDLKTHAVDFENIGISGSLQTISPFESASVDIINRYALALNWNFDNVTGSDADGSTVVHDYSSGSSELLNSDFGWNGKMAGYRYPAGAKHFPTSSTNIVAKKEINTYKFINPEQVVASDLVQTFSDEDILYPNLRKEEIVPNYVFSIEKSIYNAVTEQMLDFFAGAVDFHNLIGEPVHLYRSRYKDLEKLRNIFFERVKGVSNVEKFLSYYKWFDESISTILTQLVPASSEFVDNLLNVVESHTLERNKYQNKLNIIDSNTFWLETDPLMIITPSTAGATGYAGGAGAFALTSYPESPRATNKGVQYWQTRAERNISEISSGDATIDAQRDNFRNVIWSRPHPSGALPRFFTDAGVKYLPGTYARNNSSMLPQIRSEISNTSAQAFKWETPTITKNEIKGGINFNKAKSLEYAYSAVYPGGPINTDDGVFIPQNVLVGFIREAIELTEYENYSWPGDLVRTREKVFKVQHGREWEDGIGYKNTKSKFSFPFNVLSASVEVRSGYNKEVVDQVGRNIEITNLHTDAYGEMLEVPMQGPFTQELVGGHQSRHVPLNTGADNPTNRPEAWRLLLGTCDIFPSGAIGLVGPDYPPPGFNPAAGTNPDLIYPYPQHEKAYLYRDFTAKRPVNIKNIISTNAANTNTVMGNYRYNREILYTFGAFNNPRHFIKNQPALPVQISQSTDTTNIRTILDIHRGEQGHFENIADYDTAYLRGTSSNSIIISRFAAPGGIEVETRGYQDFKSSEYSPYNVLPYRNLTVQKPSQGPSGSISEPAGGTPSTSRVYDIHGQDFGLYSHAARHAARFGRDSLSVDNPGASYDELPAMFKQNRNTKKIIRGYDRPETYNQNLITNKYGIMFSGSTTTAQNAHLKHSGSFKDADGSTWTGKTFTLSTWLYHQSGISNQNAILTLGDVGATVGPAANRALLWGIDSSERIEFWIQTSTGNRCKWRQTAALAADTWYHIAVTYDGTSAANEPTFYLNGVSQSMTNYNGSMTSSMQSINEHGGDGNAYIGGINTTGTAYKPIRRTALDEMAIYNQVMTAGEITTLYSSGKILNLTASFAPKTASLVTWMRFGDVAGDPTINALMTQSAGVGPTFYDQMGKNNFDIRATASDIKAHLIGSALNTIPTSIAPSYILGTRTVKVTYSASIYDNLNIQHQIPRSDRQYMWISNSVVDVSDIRYAGYQYTQVGKNSPDLVNRMPWRTSSAGITPYWDFVSSSNANTGSFYQPTNRLNIVITDPVDFSNNTIGTTTIENYMNYDLIGSSSTAGTRLPNYLNQLLASRGSNYGWGWNRTRQADNRIILNQKATNTLEMVTNTSTRTSASYRLPPISMKGRVALVNYNQVNLSGPDTNVSLQISNTNNKIFFPELDLNNYAAINRSAIYNPLFEVLKVVKKGSVRTPINWVLYSQNIFPSIRNEFVSSSSKRLNFDNGYWRTSNLERRELGNTKLNSFAAEVSQSSWVLDAAYNFLTRSAIVRSNSGDSRYYNLRETQAGELQNTYYKYYTVPVTFLKIGATYARTHELDTMTSVVSPQGPLVPATGSMRNRGSASFDAAALLDQPFGGEAVWEAATQAGKITKGAQGLTFTSASSEPWFGTYDLFNENIKLKAKGFSVIPEYRMSEHVSNYYKYGYMNESVSDMLEIPGTIFNSSTGSFYKDFSNTDFLEGFLGIKAQTMLSASEIRISCTGAIKYNPYEGFYPAQRTQQLVAQFSSSFMDFFGAKQKFQKPYMASVRGSSYFQSKIAGVVKLLTDPIFSPGILYNSIKSGIAVDYPIVHDSTKRTSGSFGATAQLTNNYALVITGSTRKNSIQTTGYAGGQFWDRRIPFEAIIDPNSHLPGYDYHCMETHPSMSLYTATNFQNSYAFLQAGGDDIYSLMASNFFGQSTSFFLKGSELTKLISKTVTDDLQFKPNEVYMSRIKLRRSDNGARTYNYEYDSFSEPATTNGAGSNNNDSSAWALFGAKVISSGSGKVLSDSIFPVPQDPKRNPDFHETFTMYSRPTAFGPSCAGRPTGSDATSGAFEYAALDSFEGYNPAFTPPYTNGEAWVDLIFRPSASVTYDLERILAETKTVSWRFDPGYRVDPVLQASASAKLTFTNLSSSALIVSGAAFTLTSTDGYTLTYVAHSGSTAGDSGSSGIRFNFIQHASAGADASYALTELSSAINSNAGHNFAGNNTKFIINKNTTDKVLQLTQSVPGVLGDRAIESNSIARSSGITSSSFFSRESKAPPQPALIPVHKALQPGGSLQTSPGNDLTVPSIYDGYRINVNSMQATSSLDIFGVERVLEQKTGKFGQIGESTNKSVGKKWIISPKWESPMFNFADSGLHPISVADGTLTLPVYASASVPRGMWHQFGVMPSDPKTGVFMQIEPIPEIWLKNHYDVTINPSPYNNKNPGKNADSSELHKRAKSLAKLCGFDKTNSTQRLGQLKERMTVKEAVVAIPYFLEAMDKFELAEISDKSPQKMQRKKFVTIPLDRFNAALKESEGSAAGNSLSTAGSSIRKLAKSMETYIFPPQFDFLNNKDISPMAMYVFEFSYEFDKNDLSYIWQNLAPAEYKKLEFQAASIAHNLGNNEILNEDILMNQNLRWMVFKVKQRADKTYYELLPDQAGSSTDQIDFKTGKLGEYKFGFNWPYDYLSFVELIKMDVDILLKK